VLLLRLLSWIREQGFTPAYWSFSFGATALATLPLRLIERGDMSLITGIAPVLFIGANLVVALLVMGSIGLLVTWRLLPSAPLIPA
jgi:tellurite resistance protein